MTCTFNRHLGVAVVVRVTLAHPHQPTVKRRRGSALPLGRQEVREPSAGKAVDVVDWVAVPSKRVDEHLGPTGDALVCNL